MYMPLVRKGDIRVKETLDALEVPERCLSLTVPAQDPLNATLALDGVPVTLFFACFSPAPARPLVDAQRSRVTLHVNCDRTEVRSDVGAKALEFFIFGGVRALRTYSANKASRTWEFQVGPFALHKVELSSVASITGKRIFNLAVDGVNLVEATRKSLDCPPDMLLLQFRLLGEKSLDWEVFENDVDGEPLATKGIATQKTTYLHQCTITLPAECPIPQATFCVDGTEFSQLQGASKQVIDEPLRISPADLETTWNLRAPYKVRCHESESEVFASLRKKLGSFFNLLPEGPFSCCGRPGMEDFSMRSTPTFAYPPLDHNGPDSDQDDYPYNVA